ncbi:MAG: SOS response-associated peptidase family protein [Clostridia bacterium]|nr:SOS response-associated peptidase family protein [Clostridia bacterium]
MCQRFFIADIGEDELIAVMRAEAARRQRIITGESTVARGEAAPGMIVAALAVGRNGEIGAYPMQWGFHRPDGGLIVNTRSETALEQALLRPTLLQRRCLIPCSWYLEWESRAGHLSLLGDDAPGEAQARIVYALRPKAPGMMYLAAIYRYEADRRLPVFSILTREQAPDISFISDCMPVVFSERHHHAWLRRDGDVRAALRLCEREMACRPVHTPPRAA